VYRSRSPVFDLVLGSAGAESPAWAYLAADCREHGVSSPPPLPLHPPMSLLTVDIDFFFLPSHCLYRGENISAILETPAARRAWNISTAEHQHNTATVVILF